MTTRFWDAIGSSLAERWASVSAAALVFWLGGLLAWVHGRGGFHALQPPIDWLSTRSGPVQTAILLTALLLVAGSGVVVARLTTPTLVVMEGHWPRPLRPLRTRLTDRVGRKAASADEQFQALAGPVHDGTATEQQRDRYIRIDHQLRRLPTGHRLLPTRIGNTLRAAETRPIDKYGLDAVVVWPHLWLLLPDTTRDELTAARQSLDTAVACCLWGLLFLAFTPLTFWALPVGLGVAMTATLGWVANGADVFADLVEAAVDLHRTALYTQLRWPLPTDPADERTQGRKITTYLIRGLSGTTPIFTNGSP